MFAIGYCRISTEDQSTNSLPGQVSDIENYCKKNSLTLLKTFVDDGQSAFNFNRKEWKELESFVKINKQVKYLVISSMDRFSRANVGEALRKMEEIQLRTGVKILTVSDPVNLDLDDFGVDLRRIMELVFANYELKKIRKRTADGMYQSLKSGRFASMAPYGYKNVRDAEGKPILEIDEEKSYFIRLAFRSYLQGLSLGEISKQLKSAGWKQNGHSQLKKILSNHVYASLIRVPARNGQASYLTKGLHPPIISETDYWLTQETLNGKKIIVHKKEEVYLRGVLKCHCGRLMTAGKSKGRRKHYWYYLCKTHLVNYSAKKVHEWFEKVLENLSLPESAISEISVKLKGMIDERISSRSSDIMKTNLKLQKIKDKIASVEEKYLSTPDLSEKVYKKIIGELKSDEARLHQQLAGLNVNSEYFYSLINEVIPQLSNIKSLFFSWSLNKQQTFLNMVFNRSLVYENGIGRTPFLHELFSHNEMTLKEKGLLVVERSFDEIPISAPLGSAVEPFFNILQLISA